MMIELLEEEKTLLPPPPPQPQPREGMPREVVAWLRSLQLPRPVRHPKRDLSNGFIVALICSRYWSSITMHSYEDKLSLTNKRRNWGLLQKQLAQNKCPLSDRMIDGMIACSDGYAESFLRQLYTELTGRVVVEAAPLSAEEVTPPQTFALPSSQQRRSLSHGCASPVSTAGSTAVAASRVRGIQGRNFDDLKVLGNDSSNGVYGAAGPVQRAKRRCLQTISAVEQSGKLGDGDGEEGDGNNNNNSSGAEHARPPVSFVVSLRQAEMQQTVVRSPAKANEEKFPQSPLPPSSMQNDSKRKPQAGVAHHIEHDATALDLIESIVQTQAAGLEWPCERDANSRSVFTEYFLREENLGALLQCRIWSALLSSVPDVVKHIFGNGSTLAEIAAIFLREPSPQIQHHMTCNKPPTPGSWRCATPTTNHSVAQRYAFIASLLANMSESDAFLTVSVYCIDVLPHIKAAMQALDYYTADSYALLLCSALPTDRGLAAQFLPNVISAVYAAIIESSSVDARRSFYILLRAVLLRLSRGVHCGSRGSFQRTLNETSASFATTTTTTTSAFSATETATGMLPTGNDPLCVAVFALVGYNLVAALAHESPTVRLVGAHLAEALTSFGCTSTLLFGTIVPMLSACCTVTQSPPSSSSSSQLLNCVCAGWLRLVLRRVSNTLMGRPAEAVAGGGRIGGSHDGGGGGGGGGGAVRVEDEDPLLLQALPHLAAVMTHLCSVLQAPGSMKIRVHIAEQLALCLDDIPVSKDDTCRFFSPEKVAACVFAVLKDAPVTLVSAFLEPSPSIDPRPRGQTPTSRSGRHTAMHISSPLLGPLSTNGTLGDCYPLALLEAVIATFQDDSGPVSHAKSERSDGIGVSGQPPLTQRQNMARAAALLRERTVPRETTDCITWLYKIVVSSRGGNGFPEKPASLSDAVATKRWRNVMHRAYYDIAVLAAAAEMIYSQKNALADGAMNAILQLAGMAQQVVLRWYMELQKSAIVVMASGTTNTPPLESAERLVEAMEWYHRTYGGITAGDKQQQQQKQRHSHLRQITSLGPGRKMETGTLQGP